MFGALAPLGEFAKQRTFARQEIVPNVHYPLCVTVNHGRLMYGTKFHIFVGYVGGEGEESVLRVKEKKNQKCI